jgi:hypothetical protein
MLSAFCSVDRFVAETAESRITEGDARSEGHITDEPSPNPPVSTTLLSSQSTGLLNLRLARYSVRTRKIEDPPMHVECSLSASAICNKSGVRLRSLYHPKSVLLKPCFWSVKLLSVTPDFLQAPELTLRSTMLLLHFLKHLSKFGIECGEAQIAMLNTHRTVILGEFSGYS